MGRKFTIEDAQNKMNLVNPYFKLLSFSKVRDKNLTQCLTCNYIWEVSTDSLFRNNTSSHGCPNCKNLKVQKKYLEKGFEIKEYLQEEGKHIVKCLKCENLFSARLNHLQQENYHCPYCQKVDIKQYKIKNLLRENLQNYYLLGFLFADGHFSEDNRLFLFIQEQDKDFLVELKNLLNPEINIRKEKQSYGFSVKDTFTIQKLKEKYSIHSNKTENPCNISSIKETNLISFLIGFIDGDGSITLRTDTKSPKITIKCHYSWRDNLNYMIENLYHILQIENIPKVYINKQNEKEYVQITIGNQKAIHYLKDFIQNNSLLYFKRKWEVV